MVRDIIKNMVFNKFIKKGIDNLRFALSLDDYVPEHIMDELRNEQGFLGEGEHLEDIDLPEFKSQYYSSFQNR